MPRDRLCMSCFGNFDADDMEGTRCVYCAEGVESGFDQGDPADYEEDEDDEEPTPNAR